MWAYRSCTDRVSETCWALTCRLAGSSTQAQPPCGRSAREQCARAPRRSWLRGCSALRSQQVSAARVRHGGRPAAKGWLGQTVASLFCEPVAPLLPPPVAEVCHGIWDGCAGRATPVVGCLPLPPPPPSAAARRPPASPLTARACSPMLQPCADPLCLTCGTTPEAPCQACVDFLSSSVTLANQGDEDTADAPVFLNATSGACTPCTAHPRASGCLACTSGNCTACGDGFVLVQGSCKQCGGGPSCQACGPDLACTRCAPGTGLGRDRTCQACAGAEQGCTECAVRPAACTACERFMYLDAAGRCRPCLIDGCATCAANGRCIQCAEAATWDGTGGYLLSGGQCLECGVRNW